MSTIKNDLVEEGEVEDLEKLQAEIARMEAEAARIAQETKDLEKEKPLSNAATSATPKDADGSIGSSKPKKDG